MEKQFLKICLLLQFLVALNAEQSRAETHEYESFE